MTVEIVGRGEELAAVRAFAERPADGLATFVLVGDAGIGKSTVWLAGVEAARDHGLRVLSARPAEAEQGLAYAALGDLLASCVAEVLPELATPRRRALQAALLLDGGDGAPVDARALGVAVYSALAALAKRGPILIAIDDVQWLDPASADVVAFALRRLDREPVAVLLARRGDRLSALERARPEVVEKLPVGPLSAGAIQALVRDRLGRTLPRPTMLRVQEVSGGNPFYALELARALGALSGPLDPAEPLPVPGTLERLVEDRLRGLPEETRAALLVVAVIGAPSRELVGAAGIAPETLAPAVVAHVLEPTSDPVRFEHPLLASGVIAAATEAERRGAHRLAAAVVEEPVARARHVAAALDEPDPETAGVLEEAAGLARSRGVPSVAAELGEAAARATPPEREDDRRRRVIAAARDHLAGGSGARSFGLAQELVERAAAGRPRAEALLLLGDLEDRLGTVPRADGHYRAALADAAGLSDLEPVVHQRLAESSRLTEGLRSAHGHAQAAVQLAERQNLDALTAYALSALALVRFDLGEPDSLELAERGITLAERSGDELASRVTRGTYGHCLAWSGRIDEAREILLELRSAEGADFGAGVALFYLCLVEERAGRLALARQHAERYYRLAEQDGGTEHAEVPPILFGIARVAAAQGEVELAHELAERALAHPSARVPLAMKRANAAVLATLDAWSGSAARAVERFAAIEAEARTDGGAATAFYLSEYVEALLALGRLDDARVVLDLWENDSRKLGHHWAIPQTVRCRGLAATAEGNVEVALTLLEQAVAEHEAVGDPFGRARALLAIGVTRRRARQKRAGREAIETALAGFEEIGAAGWAEKARAELGHIGGRTRADGLTAAERRVAALVAEGKTNREVAAALFLGERTVETHLSHVYAKLGIRSRTELARVLR